MFGFSCKQFREGSKAKKGTGWGSERGPFGFRRPRQKGERGVRVRVRAQVQLRVRVPECSGQRGFGCRGAAFELEFRSERRRGFEKGSSLNKKTGSRTEKGKGRAVDSKRGGIGFG